MFLRFSLRFSSLASIALAVGLALPISLSCDDGSVGTPVSPAGKAALADWPPLRRIAADDLYDLSTINGRLLWASGYWGTIVFSDDGGKTWRRQETPSRRPLFSIAMADARRGWAVGKGGIVLRTRDGGNSWLKQEIPRRQHLFSLAVIDAETAWAVGDFGLMLYTNNGGRTWQDRSLMEEVGPGGFSAGLDEDWGIEEEEEELGPPEIRNRDVILNEIFFLDRRHGWVVGEYGIILRTRDGGETWQEAESVPEEGLDAYLYGVGFLGTKRGWAVGLGGVLLRTTDGGSTWQLERSGTRRPLFAVSVTSRGAVAIGERGIIRFEEDGERAWRSPLRSPDPEVFDWLRAIELSEDGRGWIVGEGGLLLGTTDGGASWGWVEGGGTPQAESRGGDSASLEGGGPA